ncbi:MAG: hypothetical protein FWH55_12795 [Oscillospiraceae bacterium]|nr:hypothetical protein [Oscillospiraceae bacterium]
MEEMLPQAESPEQWLNDMMRELLDHPAAEQDNFSALAIWVGTPEESIRRMPVRKN